MAVTLPDPTTVALPREFTLHLGTRSAEHVAVMAKILEQMGAEVEVNHEGSLVAVRPRD